MQSVSVEVKQRNVDLFLFFRERSSPTSFYFTVCRAPRVAKVTCGDFLLFVT